MDLRKSGIFLSILHCQFMFRKKFRAPAKRLKLEPPSVVYNLFKMFKWEFLAASAIKMFSDVLQFANPFLLK